MKIVMPVVSWRMKMEAVRPSKTLVSYHITTRCHNQENYYLITLFLYRIISSYGLFNEMQSLILYNFMTVYRLKYLFSVPWENGLVLKGVYWELLLAGAVGFSASLYVYVTDRDGCKTLNYDYGSRPGYEPDASRTQRCHFATILGDRKLTFHQTGTGVKWSGYEADHSPPSRSDVRNAGSYTSIQPNLLRSLLFN
jgi:hypothetical protein